MIKNTINDRSKRYPNQLIYKIYMTNTEQPRDSQDIKKGICIELSFIPTETTKRKLTADGAWEKVRRDLGEITREIIMNTENEAKGKERHTTKEAEGIPSTCHLCQTKSHPSRECPERRQDQMTVLTRGDPKEILSNSTDADRIDI